MNVPRGWKGIAHNVLEAAGVHEGDGGLVRVPYCLPDGETTFEKVFIRGGRSWYEPSGITLIPFGLETLPGGRFARYAAVVVAEGESDCLAAREAVEGYEDERAVAWYAIALPGAGSWRSEWRQYLRPFPLVYVVGDGDAPGRAMNAVVRRDAPWVRPVWFPAGEDLRSILQREGLPGLLPHLATADLDFALEAAFVAAGDVRDFESLVREYTAPRPRKSTTQLAPSEPETAFT